MSQYTNNPRQNRTRGGSGYRYDSGRSEFMTVLLFYVIPFLVVNTIIFILVTATPKGTVTIGETSDYVTTTIELKVKSLLPIKQPVVKLDGADVAITKIDSKTYTATLNSNGGLEVDLSAVNGMKNVFFLSVNILDDTPPTAEDRIIEDGVLSFRLDDTQAGVDYSSVFAIDDDSSEILPLSIDRSTGIVTFEMKKENLTICAKDKIGNEMRATITPEGESVDNTAEGTSAGDAGGESSTEAAGEV